jgi:hypothetical protein
MLDKYLSKCYSALRMACTILAFLVRKRVGGDCSRRTEVGMDCACSYVMNTCSFFPLVLAISF